MKVLSYLLIVLGSIPTIYFGVIPIILIYPSKPGAMNWGWILFGDVNRLYWQVGLAIMLLGFILFLIGNKRYTAKSH